MLTETENAIVAACKATTQLNNLNAITVTLAQLAAESFDFTRTVENLNYSASRLVQVFPHHFNASNVDDYVGHPEKIANTIYAGIDGNGNPQSGDGYLFRGRGFIQLTGRYNYQRVGKLAGINLENAPDTLIADLAINIKASIAFLLDKSAYAKAASSGDMHETTLLINGGLNGLQDRITRYTKYTNILKGSI